MVAGLISFFTIVYIIIVNASILAEAGIPYEAGVIATILASFIGCLLMGLWSNSPMIIAPGMGLNAMFTYTFVKSGGFTWQESLAIVFVSGLLFTMIAFTPLAKIITKAIPETLKDSITVGIGILLMFIGFGQSGIITSSKTALLALGDLSSPTALVTIIGLIITILLFIKNFPGGLLVSILTTSFIAALFGVVDVSSFKWTAPSFSSYSSVFGAMSWDQMMNFSFWLTSFSLAMIVVFENIGLNHGHEQVTKQPEKFDRAFQANALSVLSCGLLGSSPTVSVLEGASGIAYGGRTGLTSVTTAILFLSAIFFIPVLKMIPSCAISPVLILIGTLMIQGIKNIPFGDLTESLPAVLIIVLIPLTFSIADGMAIGFIMYPLLKLLTGKGKVVSIPLYIIAILFVANFSLHYLI